MFLVGIHEHEISHFELNHPVACSTFKMLYNLHLCPISKYFLSPQRETLYPLSSLLLIAPSVSQYAVFMDLPILFISCKWNHTMYDFCVYLLPYHTILEDHLHVARVLTIFSCDCWLFVYLLWINVYGSHLLIFKLSSCHWL